MRLLVIRHGESEADLLDVHEGRADFELTQRGHSQAKAMSRWISSRYSISKIYCSTLKRAFQTTSHLSKATNIPLCKESKLMEFNNGLIAGLERNVVKEKYPFIPNLPIHSAVYEQESILEFRFRSDFILSKIISENNENDTIAIVTHGGMINQLYRSFLRLPVDSNIFVATGDTGIHEWIVTNDSKRIVFSNNCSHTANLKI